MRPPRQRLALLRRAVMAGISAAALSLISPARFDELPSMNEYEYAAPAAGTMLSGTRSIDELLSGSSQNLPGKNDSTSSAIPADAYNVLGAATPDFYRELPKNGERYLFVVDKDTQSASMYRLAVEKIDETGVSTGRAPGDKQREGDLKTPNGLFEVVSLEDSSSWRHNGEAGAYGRYFSRLSAGSWDQSGNYNPGARSSIAVHGTNQPGMIGKRASEGCIRLPNQKNEDYVQNKYLGRGTIVAVVGDGDGDSR